MAILHGNWLPAAQQGYDAVAGMGSLFLWGETWRRAKPSNELFKIVPHALAMTPVELAEHLTQQAEAWKLSQGVEDAIATPPKRLRKTKKPGPVYWGNQTVSLLAQWQDDSPAICHSNLQEAEGGEFGLQPVQVTGLYLSLPEAIAFLNGLPLNPGRMAEKSLGDDLIYWSHTLRWV